MLLLFARSVAGVVEILIMIALGYLLTNLGWFNESASKLIARLVTQVALPAYMAYTITSKFSFNKLIGTLPDLRFPVVSMLILFIVSIVVAKVLHIKESHRGLFESMFFLIPIRFLSAYPLTLRYSVPLRACHTFWFTIWPIPPSFGRLACT